MPKSLTPQLRTILAHVKRAGHITARAALIDHGICALPRRIADLKELGYEVRKERTKNDATGQRYVRYFVGEKKVASGRDPRSVKLGDTIRWTNIQHAGEWQSCVVTEVRDFALSRYPVSAAWDGKLGAFSLNEIEILG